jgi:hypothetical protein
VAANKTVRKAIKERKEKLTTVVEGPSELECESLDFFTTCSDSSTALAGAIVTFFLVTLALF